MLEGTDGEMADQPEVPMTDLATNPETEVEIDRELLEEAQRQISATSPNVAINEALRRLVETERAKRRAAGEAVHRMVKNGELDFRALDSIDE
jgi:Arc/MetJ family transcription regulator